MQHWSINKKNLTVMLVSGAFLAALIWWNKKNEQWYENQGTSLTEIPKDFNKTIDTPDRSIVKEFQLKLSKTIGQPLESVSKETLSKLYFNEAREQIISRNLKEALVLLNLTLENDPNLAIAYSTRGDIIAELGEPQKGLPDLEKAAVMAPDDYIIRHNYARWLQNQGFYRKAEDNFKHSLQIQPETYESLHGLCSVYVLTKEAEKGLEACNAALRIAKNKADPLYNRGLIYFHMKRFEAALKDVDTYRGLVLQDPVKYSAAISLSGHIYMAAGNKEKASVMYEEAIKLRAGDKDFILVVIEDYFESGGGKEAPDLLGRYIRSNTLSLPEKAKMYRTQSSFYDRAGYFDEAIQALREAVKTYALMDNPEIEYQDIANEIQKLQLEKTNKKSKSLP